MPPKERLVDVAFAFEEIAIGSFAMGAPLRVADRRALRLSPCSDTGGRADLRLRHDQRRLRGRRLREFEPLQGKFSKLRSTRGNPIDVI